MKQIQTYILTIFLLWSCNSTHKKQVSNENSSKIDSSYLIIQSNLQAVNLLSDSIYIDSTKVQPKFSYKFKVNSATNILESIKVYDGSNMTQEIIANKDIERKEFSLVDWNFDGYMDITSLYNCGSGGRTYWIWNYSPQKKQYYFNKELSEVIGLEIDTVNKFIIIHFRAGYNDESWDSLQYKNNKLSFVKGLYRERWNDQIGNAWEKKTYSKLVSNKILVTVDSVVIGSAY